MYLRIMAWGGLGTYVSLLLTLTHMPKPPGVFEAASDKTWHFLAYTTLAFLSYTASVLTWRDKRFLTVLVFIACAIFGALDESTQPLFGRHADVKDYWFDLLGIGFGLLSGALACRAFKWIFIRRADPV